MNVRVRVRVALTMVAQLSNKISRLIWSSHHMLAVRYCFIILYFKVPPFTVFILFYFN